MKKTICEKCGSKYNYTTKKEIVCRKCGHRKKIQDKKGELLK